MWSPEEVLRLLDRVPLRRDASNQRYDQTADRQIQSWCPEESWTPSTPWRTTENLQFKISCYFQLSFLVPVLPCSRRCQRAKPGSLFRQGQEPKIARFPFPRANTGRKLGNILSRLSRGFERQGPVRQICVKRMRIEFLNRKIHLRGFVASKFQLHLWPPRLAS